MAKKNGTTEPNTNRNGKSLLEIAKTAPVTKRSGKPITDEDQTLAIAWVKDEVTVAQCVTAWESNNTSTYIKLARTLKQYIRSTNAAA